MPLGRQAAGGGGSVTAAFTSIGDAFNNGNMFSLPPMNTDVSIGRADGATPTWDAGWEYDRLGAALLIPGAVANWSGMALGATPTVANLTLSGATNNVHPTKNFEIQVYGLQGSVTSPFFSNTPGGGTPLLAEFTTATTPAQLVTNATTSLTFDISAILAEMASDVSWDVSRNVWLFFHMTAATGTMGFTESSEIAFTNLSLEHDL